MSFFIKGKHLNTSRRAKFSKVKQKKRKLNSSSAKNEEVTSSEDEDVNKDLPDPSSSEDENETAQEKKIRLAKIYLEEIEKEEKQRLENKDLEEGVLSKRLKEEYLKETGKLHLTVSGQYKGVNEEQIRILKCRKHRSSITCLCITADDKYVFTGSKDGVIVKYSLLECRKIGIIPFTKKPNPNVGHSKKILSLTVSSDSKFLVVGDESSDIHIWDPNTLKFIKKLSGHKDAITGLCFKKDSHTLYSCSRDRTAKVWSLDEMAYVETLFGHQDSISSIDTLYKDRVVTCGGRDLRVWKITEETQLIFNGHVGNIDCVKLINEETFITCGDDGQICVWSIMRKKPLCVISNAHGIDTSNQQPLWISSVTALVNTDLVASGSQDGFVKLWKLNNNFKSSSLLFQIPVVGFVNALSFTSNGETLLVVVSREHKFGRWTTEKSAKNCIMIIPLIKS